MHLHELLGWHGPMTARQARAWDEWREQEELKPTTADSYTMQLTDVVSQVVSFLQCGRKVNPDQWRIDFTVGPPTLGDKPRERPPASEQDVLSQADADVEMMLRHFGGLGMVKGAEKFFQRTGKAR